MEGKCAYLRKRVSRVSREVKSDFPTMSIDVMDAEVHMWMPDLSMKPGRRSGTIMKRLIASHRRQISGKPERIEVKAFVAKGKERTGELNTNLC